MFKGKLIWPVSARSGRISPDVQLQNPVGCGYGDNRCDQGYRSGNGSGHNGSGGGFHRGSGVGEDGCTVYGAADGDHGSGGNSGGGACYCGKNGHMSTECYNEAATVIRSTAFWRPDPPTIAHSRLPIFGGCCL